MRDIHPAYPETTIGCACGNSVQTRSTRGNFTVDVCGNCHPFYTGKQKLMDTAGRVDRFRKKFGDTQVSAKKSTPSVAAPAPGGGKKEKKKAAAAAEAAPAAEATEAAAGTDEPKSN